MTPASVPASRSSVTARIRSAPLNRSGQSSPVLPPARLPSPGLLDARLPSPGLLDARLVRAALGRVGQLLKLNRGLALVVDQVPHAEDRGGGVEQPARAGGDRRVEPAPGHRDHVVPAPLVPPGN